MGATRNTGYLENIIAYDASNNVAIATSVNPSYKVTLGGSLSGTSATFSTEVTSSGSQGRFGGWATGAGYQGAALEAGVSGGTATLLGYNRTTSAYIPLTIGGNTNQTTTIGGNTIVLQNNGVTALSIASTGAATFNSEGITINRSAGNPYIIFQNTGSDLGSIYGNTGGGIRLRNATSDVLTISSTGAATFSSSVTAATETNITGTSVNSRLLVTAAGVANTVLGFNNSGATTTGVTNNTSYVGVLQAYPLVFITDSTERLRISSTGAATFSSSVTAVGLSSTTSANGNLNTYIRNSVTAASGVTGYGLAIESEASAATSYALTVRNLAGSNTYFHISTETGKVGNVGIGTTSPTNPLHIQSNTLSQLNVTALSGNTNAQINLEPTGTGIALIGPANNVDFAFRTNATERMRITSGGNVGIGTASPAALFDLTVNNAKTASASVYAYLGKTNESTNYAALQLLQIGAAAAANRVWSFQTIEQGVANAGIISFQPNGGNVGIGSSSPSQLLTLRSTTGYPVIDFWNNSTAYGDLGYQTGAGMVLSAYSTTPLLFYTNSAERIRITSGGVVLINQTSTSETARLYIKQATDGDFKGHIVESAAAAGYVGSMSIDSSGNLSFAQSYVAAGGSYQGIKFTTSGSERMRIKSDGEVLIGTTTDAGAYVLQVNGSVYATAYYESSDIRLKDVLTNSYSENFSAIEFMWKDKRDDKKHWGYAAQDVMKYIPDAIEVNNDGMMTVNYNEAHTWKIMMSERKIAELEAKILELEAKLK